MNIWISILVLVLFTVFMVWLICHKPVTPKEAAIKEAADLANKLLNEPGQTTADEMFDQILTLADEFRFGAKEIGFGDMDHLKHVAIQNLEGCLNISQQDLRYILVHASSSGEGYRTVSSGVGEMNEDILARIRKIKATPV